MKVYIIESLDRNYKSIVGVYLNKEKAEKIAEERRKKCLGYQTIIVTEKEVIE